MDTKLRLLLWFLLMCGWTFKQAQCLKKNTKKRIKSGISMGAQLTPAIISLLSDPSSIKNMKWKQIGELLQDLAESIYGVENELEEFGDDLEDLQEVAESNTVAYLSGLPILAIVIVICFLAFLCNLRRIMAKVKRMNLGTNLDQIRHQVQTFFKIRNLEVPQDIERGFQRHPDMVNQPGIQYMPGMYPNLQNLPVYAPPANPAAQNLQPDQGLQVPNKAHG